MLLWSKGNDIRKLAGHIVYRFVIGGRAGFPFLSDSVIPGVTAPQDFLKVFLESECGVESDSQKFNLRTDFESVLS